VRPSSDAAGVVDATTEDGRRASVSFSFAPHRPPRIQDYEVKITDTTEASP
jgi:hypothetical protein